MSGNFDSRQCSRSYVSPDEFVALSGLSIATVYRRVRAGQLPAIQPGGARTRWLIDKTALRMPSDQALNKLPEQTSPVTESGSPTVTISSPAACDPSTFVCAESAQLQQDRNHGPRPRWEAKYDELDLRK